jgi:hypothetical protein
MTKISVLQTEESGSEPLRVPILSMVDARRVPRMEDAPQIFPCFRSPMLERPQTKCRDLRELHQADRTVDGMAPPMQRISKSRASTRTIVAGRHRHVFGYPSAGTPEVASVDHMNHAGAAPLV